MEQSDKITQLLKKEVTVEDIDRCLSVQSVLSPQEQELIKKELNRNEDE